MTRSRRAGIVCTTALLAGALMNCGGSSSSSPAAPPPPPSVSLAGVWTATDTRNTTYHVLVLPTSLTFRSLDSNMLQGSGKFTLSGSALGGTITVFPTAALASIGYPVQQGTISGTGSASAITDTITLAAGTATTSLAPDTPNNGTVQLSALAGTYAADAANTASSAGGTLTLAADGSLTGSDPGGTLTGTLQQVAAGLNAFNAAITYTPAGAAPKAYAGLAFYRPGASPSIVVMTDNGTGQLAGIFTKVP